MRPLRAAALFGLTMLAGLGLTLLAHHPGVAGQAGAAFWCAVAAFWLFATWVARDLAAQDAIEAKSRLGRRAAALSVPLLFGAVVLVLWETGTVGGGVPFVLLPPPSSIAVRVAASLPTLSADLVQTFVKSALVGYAIGCGAGFVTAIACDRVPFLRRGLLPIGTFTAALPIVGIAPITVMWFGFDWPSKAAVVAVMTFFPMLVNVCSGLQASDASERDLMRTYAAGYVPTLLKLRLPAALPFIFNGLKIGTTLALIGAIVAEFFGTPIVGMGFRISIEAARMSLDMVWAEIALAAIAGSFFYGSIVLIERAATGWHPSMRPA